MITFPVAKSCMGTHILLIITSTHTVSLPFPRWMSNFVSFASVVTFPYAFRSYPICPHLETVKCMSISLPCPKSHTLTTIVYSTTYTHTPYHRLHFLSFSNLWSCYLRQFTTITTTRSWLTLVLADEKSWQKLAEHEKREHKRESSRAIEQVLSVCVCVCALCSLFVFRWCSIEEDQSPILIGSYRDLSQCRP